MHFEACSPATCTFTDKNKAKWFFCFFFPNFKNSIPWHNDILRSFSTVILGLKSWFLAYLMKIDVRLQKGCLPWSPVFGPDHFFEYAFHRVLFWLIFICAYLRFYSNVPFVRHVMAALRITLVACIINHVDLGKVWKEQSQRYGRYVQRKPDVAACQQ